MVGFRSVLVLFILLINIWSAGAISVRLSGTVSEENGAPIPFASVYVEGSSTGTTTNLDGKYVLDLESGTYKIVFRFIGFKQKTELIQIGKDPVLRDVTMLPESYQLAEVNIVAGAEDPAYAIIRKAQAQRKNYLKEVDEFKCKAYVKSTQKLDSYPKKILGQKVELDEFVDTVTRIFYLSETVSDFSFRQPDRIKEEIISSTLSGNPKGYSFNQAADLRVDYYENLIQLGGLTPRGIVSPISANALFYYDYRLEGTFVENGNTINKISVIPKRKNDPVWSGDIFILDDSWRIHSLDLTITKEQQLQFVDTFRIKQSFLPIEKDLWMLFNTQYSYQFNVIGFKGNGKVLGIFSQYQLKPDFPKGYFDGQVLKVNKESNLRDSLYWVENRPVPLTAIEVTDYHRKDSTRVIYESKSYRDSIDSIDNKFGLTNVLLGYTYTNSYKGEEYSYSSPLEGIQFNTVEGWNAALNFSYTKAWKEPTTKSLKIAPSVRYGFSNQHFNGMIDVRYQYNSHRRSMLSIEGGKDVVQFNASKPISPTVNTIYSLLDRKNFMKIYEKLYAKVGHESELFNGVRFGLNGEYAERIPLVNTTDYSFAAADRRTYTSNDPVHVETDDLPFVRNESFVLEGELRIRFRQEYIDRPEGKYIIGAKYPELRVIYRKGFAIFNGDTDYDLVQLTISDQLRFGLLGSFKYQASVGDFINSDAIYIMDMHHFNGNKTWFTSFRLSDFRNLDYYSFSTSSTFVEGHAEHNFGGFLLNKIPLIRKLKLNEVAGVHYFHTEAAGHYGELTLGVEKLNFIRIEAYTSFAEGKRSTWGVAVGIRRTINGR
ncbi:MAG: carboxypeptidase-like regulatory domain-containing protein [Bacteroidia bacterium]|nr:carboxypeptidase-like regulatory domain-containing protein [Bacteroidia bacterium]